MRQLPSTSVVVPSLNRARYLGETLQSLVDQDYPGLEVIVQDGNSTDGSIAIAQEFVRRFPHAFRLFVEPDSGHGDALNRGFGRASGEILGYLIPGDRLLPRILHRVAHEIDPARNRLVVMGRCLFSGEGLLCANIEYPRRFASYIDYLAIWKRGFNEAPQPSVFWHRRVWEHCGGFDAGLQHALDYDLFCRIVRHYPFCLVDDFWSTFRIDDVPRAAQLAEAELLELSIAVSRRHWGSRLSPLRWRCEVSYGLYCLQFHEHARHHARLAENALKDRRLPAACVELAQTMRYSPSMAWDRLLCRWLAMFRRLVARRLSG